MPTQTNKLASGTAGGTSSDIAVDQGQLVVVGVYATDGGSLPVNTQAQLLRKVGTAYIPEPDVFGGNTIITSERQTVVLGAPGTYAIRVQPSSKAVSVEEWR